MTIGELARHASVNPRTLRYYERIGLLAPSARSAAGYRLYSDRDVGRLAFIRQAQALGLSLAEIADIIAVREAGSAPCGHVRSLALAKVAAIDTRLADLQALRKELLALVQRARAAEAAPTDDATICRAIEGATPHSA